MVQDTGGRVFRRWKRRAVCVPFLPVLLGMQDVGRYAVNAAGLVSELPTTLLRCMMTACAGAAGCPSYEVADHLIRRIGFEHLILLIIAIVVVIIKELVSGGWPFDPSRVAFASY